jgi:hypothetical protein
MKSEFNYSASFVHFFNYLEVRKIRGKVNRACNGFLDFLYDICFKYLCLP